MTVVSIEFQRTEKCWDVPQLRPFQAYWTYSISQPTTLRTRLVKTRLVWKGQPVVVYLECSESDGVKLQMAEFRRPGLEALELTLKSVLDGDVESAVQTVERNWRGDVHIVRGLYNGHYLSIIQAGSTETGAGTGAAFFKEIFK